VGSSIDNGTILLSESFDWMDVLDVLASGMIGSGGGGGLTKVFFNSYSFVDAMSLSATSQLSLLQS
jgi:hypothetical protein